MPDEHAQRIEPPFYETNVDLEAAMPHLVWELDQVLSNIGFEDLKPSEVASLLVVLVPVHCRVLTAPEAAAQRRLLRLVRDDY